MKELAAYSILLASARATPKIHSPMSDIDVFFSLCLLLLVCVFTVVLFLASFLLAHCSIDLFFTRHNLPVVVCAGEVSMRCV